MSVTYSQNSSGKNVVCMDIYIVREYIYRHILKRQTEKQGRQVGRGNYKAYMVKR